jgi:[ribosomal protein S5]-alanine N-acetyltransferase
MADIAAAPWRFDGLRLDTPRLLLRPLGDDDAPALLAIFSDPRVTQYWSTPPWTDVAQALAMVARDRDEMARGESLRLGLQRRSDGLLLGHCSLFRFNSQCRRAELGYGQGADSWGQGYMHEALSALLEHAFDTLDLNRIEADIDPRNAASQRTLERLGFTREGFLRERWIVAGEVSDTALYGLLQREWRARPVQE